MVSLARARKDRLLNNKVFKDDNDFEKHMSLIQDENKNLDFENRTYEVKNWLEYIKLN
jgi:GMP synthase (glutamine-hydrolysing)